MKCFQKGLIDYEIILMEIGSQIVIHYGEKAQ